VEGKKRSNGEREREKMLNRQTRFSLSLSMNTHTELKI
jgi:hypothetical protein